MDFNLLLRYLLEFAMLLPAAVMALLPSRKSFRYRTGIVCAAAAVCIVGLALIGSLLAATFALPTNAVLVPESLLLLAPLWRVSLLDPIKKVHCFANACMLCAFSTMYATFVTAPWELGNDDIVFTTQSGVICLVVGLAVCALFSRTLAVKLPALFGFASLDGVWKWTTAVMIATTAFLAWITPVSAVNVMTGFVFQKSLVIMPIIPFAIWLIYHVSWLAASRIAEEERLKRENDMLKMEERRLGELLSFIDHARATRHDFRHHMAVVTELAEAENAGKTAAYAGGFVEKLDQARLSKYCENAAIDAVAAHYDRLAKGRDVSIAWTIDLPMALSVSEVDLCSVLGNLVENAIEAAYGCAGRVDVKASAFPGGAITVVVENPFSGTIVMGPKGLPRSSHAGHGVGLASVAAIAGKHGGSLSVGAQGSVFTASAVLYPR